MSTKNKYCEWMGHAGVSAGTDKTTDFPSERFTCTRCELTYTVSEWAPPLPTPKIRKVAYCVLIVLALLLACYLLGLFNTAKAAEPPMSSVEQFVGDRRASKFENFKSTPNQDGTTTVARPYSMAFTPR